MILLSHMNNVFKIIGFKRQISTRNIPKNYHITMLADTIAPFFAGLLTKNIAII